MISKTLTTVAIIGGGPCGLASAIALSELPHLSVTLYEQHSEPREAGAGISLSANAWKILDLLGAADGVKGGSKSNTQHRNGISGEILQVTERPESSDSDERGAIRARRTRLQSALLAKVPPGVIEYNKKLKSLENLGSQGVQLSFHDGSEVLADIVVGADGIHSAVRRALYPDHELHFTGNVAFRTLVPVSSLAHLEELTEATAWWFGDSGHAYFSPVDDESDGLENPYFEITIRSYHETEVPGKTVKWGVPATNDKVKSRVKNFDQRVKDAVAVVPEGQWREFSAFAGPRLPNIIGWDKVVLVGDASHPLSGAYGSGAAFAMEDGWILARCLEHTRNSPDPVTDALHIFDQIRSPYYDRMYADLDLSREILQKLPSDLSLDERLKARIASFFEGNKDFIYKNDISKVWKNYLEGKDLYLK